MANAPGRGSRLKARGTKGGSAEVPGPSTSSSNRVRQKSQDHILIATPKGNQLPGKTQQPRNNGNGPVYLTPSGAGQAPLANPRKNSIPSYTTIPDTTTTAGSKTGRVGGNPVAGSGGNDPSHPVSDLGNGKPLLVKMNKLKRRGGIKRYLGKVQGDNINRWYKEDAICVPQNIREEALARLTWSGTRRKKYRSTVAKQSPQ